MTAEIRLKIEYKIQKVLFVLKVQNEPKYLQNVMNSHALL